MVGRIRPIGGMDRDSELLDVRPGDYLNARNVRSTSNNGQTTNDTEIILGNDPAFDVRQVSVTPQTIRFYVNTTVDQSDTIQIKDQNGVLFTTVTLSTSGNVGNIAGFLTYAVAEIQTALSGAGVPGIVTSGVDSAPLYGHIDLTLTAYPGQRFTVLTTYLYRTLVDAIDGSLTGSLKQIGSVDLLGKLFLFSTTATSEPRNIEVVNVAGMIVTVGEPHGLPNNSRVVISGVQGATGANGSWIINVLSTVSFSLLGATGFAPYTSGGTVTIYPQGMGEVGVAQMDELGTWTYIRLVRSTGLNFITKKQFEVKAEVDGEKYSIYFTDDYNNPRVLYYYGPFVTDGFLTADNPQGIYTLDTIAEESIMVSGSPNIVTSVSQIPGGNLLSGNWRYSVSMGFQGGEAYTEWSALTNPISVFAAAAEGSADAERIVGNNGNERAAKSNVVRVDNIPLGVYGVVRLAGVQYVENVPVGAIILEQSISPLTTFAELTHTGNEVTQELDLGTLGQIFASIRRAQNIVLIDNRAVLSNVEVNIDYDLLAWAKTIQYTVKRKTDIVSMGNLGTTPPLQLGEYLVPQNVHDFVGLTINETYRAGVEVKWKNSGWSKTYWVDDIIIDISGASGQRLGGLPDYSVTDAGGDFIYIPYVEFTNVNLDYVLPTGRTLRDSIEAIRFVRAPLIQEVLATGMIVINSGAGNPNANPFLDPPVVVTGAENRTICHFISPDVYFRKAFPGTPIQVRVFDNPVPVNSETPSAGSTIAEYDGFLTNGTTYNTYSPTTVSSLVIDSDFEVYRMTFPAPVNKPTSAALDYGFYYAQIFRARSNKYGAPETSTYETTGCQSVDITNITTSTTFNMFGGDTFTQKSFKKVISTSPTGRGAGFFSQNKVNSSMQIAFTSTAIATLPGIEGAGVTGQNAMLTLPIGNPSIYNEGYSIRNGLQSYIAYDASAQEISDQPVRMYYSEIKPVNSFSDQYRIFLPFNFRDLQPGKGPIEHMEVLNRELFTWQPRSFQRQYFNARGTLSSSDSSQILVGDGSVLSREGDELSLYGTNHKWSVIKGVSPGGKDTCYWVNVEQKKIMRFGQDGTVTLSDIKGLQSWLANHLNFTASALTPADNYGIHGVYDNRFQEAIFTVRALRPGVVTVTNGATTIIGIYYITSEKDFCGMSVVYTAKSIFVVSAQNFPGTSEGWETYWDKVSFEDGNVYSYWTLVLNEYRNRFTAYYGFLPKIYAKFNDTFLSQHPTGSMLYQHNKGEYCEWYKETLTGVGVIAVTANSKTVMGIGTNFLTQFSSPALINYGILVDGTAYTVESVERDDSLTLKEVSATTATLATYEYERSLVEDGFIEMILNENPDVSKVYKAMRVNSFVEPMLVELRASTTETYMTDEDFEETNLEFNAPVKNDSTVTAENPTGSNEADTDNVFGKYVKVKLFLQAKTYQKLFDAFVKYVPSARLFNK